MSNVHFLKSAPTRLAASAPSAGAAHRARVDSFDGPDTPEHMPLATLDALDLAAIVVDRRLRIAWASRSARRDLGRTFGSLEARSLLKPGRSGAADRLSQAVRIACAGEASDLALPAGAADSPVLVRALPFGPSGDEGLALLLLVDLGAGDRGESGAVENRLSALFGLTPMEARVACRLAQGDGMGRVAAALGIAVSTARTHAARCYEKTGVRRQAALARLAHRLRMV